MFNITFMSSVDSQILTQLKHLESLIIAGSKTVLSAPEAAQYLGITKQYLYRLTSGKKLPYFKPESKKIYLKKSDLDFYLLRNRVSSSEELQDKATSYVTTKKKGGKR